MFSRLKKKAAATAALAKAELAKRTGVEDKAEVTAPPQCPSPTTSSGRRALPPTPGPADGKEDCDDTATPTGQTSSPPSSSRLSSPPSSAAPSLSRSDRARSFGSRLSTGLGKVKDGVVKAGASAKDGATKAGQSASPILGKAKSGILAVTHTVDLVSKTLLDARLARVDSESREFLVLTQANVWRRQGTEAVSYTLDLPANLARDAAEGRLLFNGGPPPGVMAWINGVGDPGNVGQNKRSQEWLCQALDMAHMAAGVKNAATELLSVKAFTSNLQSMQLFGPIKKHCTASLLKIGKGLDTYFQEEDLERVLGGAPLPLHPAAQAEQAREQAGEQAAAGDEAGEKKDTDAAKDTGPHLSLRRQDHPVVGLLPAPHTDGWTFFEEECVYIHQLRLVALAIDSSYQEIVKQIAHDACIVKERIPHTFSPASIKVRDRRMVVM